MSGNFFRGTTAEQDTRFSNKEAKLLKSHKHFAPDLDKPVDIHKVNMEVMMKWIVKRVTELLGMEDEVLCGFIEGLLQEKGLNGKKMQLSLTGFMEKNTGRFMKELWELLMSAQANTSGIPQQFLDEKAAELRAKKAEEARIADEVQRKRDAQELEREREREERQKLREERHAADVALRDQQRPKLPPAPEKDRLSPRPANGARARSPPPSGQRTRTPSPTSASPPPRGARRLPSPALARSQRTPPRTHRRSPPARRRTPPRYYRSPGRNHHRQHRRSPSVEGHRREGRSWRGPPSQTGSHSTRYDRSRSPLQRRLRRHPSNSPDRRAAAAPLGTHAHQRRDLPPPPPPPRGRSPASSASDRSSPEGSPPQRTRQTIRPRSRTPPSRPRERSPSGGQLRRGLRERPAPLAEMSQSPPSRRGRSEGESGGEEEKARAGVRRSSRGDAESDSDERMERKRKGDDERAPSPADSEERREAKRRRKEEKRKRKEERQKKREEKQRRRAEREARRAVVVDGDGDGDGKGEQDGSDSGGGEERRKALEERLRLKALESMRARARQGPD